MKHAVLYTKDDVGYHIDGALGVYHARNKLQDMLENCLCAYSPGEGPRPYIEKAQVALDDLDYDWPDAVSILQDHTADGLVWLWEAGDLILTIQQPTRLSLLVRARMLLSRNVY